MIHAFCEDCGRPHATGAVYRSEEAIGSHQSIGDIYDGRPVPIDILNALRVYFTCPITGKRFAQRELNHLYLVQVNQTQYFL